MSAMASESVGKLEPGMEDSGYQMDNSGDEDDFEDEDVAEGTSGPSGDQLNARRMLSGRGVTLMMLINEGIIETGDGVLTIDYLGSKFVGDLLPGGKIRWQDSKEIFSSPSAWATHCKKILNPEKKSGCGWSTIRYKGKRLDLFKTIWYRKQRKQQMGAGKTSTHVMDSENKSGTQTETSLKESRSETRETSLKPTGIFHSKILQQKSSSNRLVVNHCVLGNRTPEHDMNTLVTCTPFTAMDRIQPFTVTIATNCLLLIDFHCHLSNSEVVGYLGGSWDIASHNLALLQAFPCRCRLGDKDNAGAIEEEIRQSLEQRHLTLVGWYHSHPTFPAYPSIKDIDSQMEYQITMKGDSDSAYTPCLGLIISPYNKQRKSCEAEYQAYWVMPPPEHRPQEYGHPMQMAYNIAHDSFLTQDLLMEMRLLADFYRGAEDFIIFKKEYQSGSATYWQKLQKSLTPKLPQDLQVTGAQTPTQSQAQAQAVAHFWDFVRGLVMV
ncbi:MPN domain-containing protein-like isoform X1 [Limulus polyphemus]|uniref:MPN domain-containing protein-like isoform X1 n=2 Tax=Limulus polyphemus TaxID=6850 RepID=A0ABM1SLJ0_LIMPO|nr:MPN domain-containing protein-like isoform X1 [Limulus polyphemus]